MSEDPIKALLEDYKAQRAYRQSKRDEYMRRFEVLKQSFSQNPQKSQNVQHSSPKVEHKVSPKVQNHGESIGIARHEHSHAIQNQEQFRLLQQNEALKRQLVQVETQQRERLLLFKDQIAKVKTRYIEDIKSLSESAQKSKKQSESKIQKLQAQTQIAISKNKEIEQFNGQIKKELQDGNVLMGKYATEIKKEYAEKIIEFEKIFNSSNDKILAMEKEFNEDQFVENTLKNEELLKSIEENAQKAEEASKILDDYQLLLTGKKEILAQIQNNTAMKEKEIAKMSELQGKIKLIMQKMSEEKKVYVAENSKMAQELIEIKNLLMGAMNQGQ